MLGYMVAIFGDLVGMIPWVNMVSDPITAGSLWVVGKAEGINIFGPTMLRGTLLAFAAKFFPGLSTLLFCSWTVQWYFARKLAHKQKAQKASTTAKTITRSSSGFRL